MHMVRTVIFVICVYFLHFFHKMHTVKHMKFVHITKKSLKITGKTQRFCLLLYLVNCIILHKNTFFKNSCEEWQPDKWIRQLQGRFSYYCFGCIVDFVVLLFYLVCVDRSGSLSGGAFNQLKLVTLKIVLTILYSLKSVSQRSLLQCLNSSIGSTKSSNIFSRRSHCNIK